MVSVGDMFECATTKSGRRWRVVRRARDGNWVLAPVGDDVRPAQVGNRMNGGVRTLRRGDELLNNVRRWRRVTGGSDG